MNELKHTPEPWRVGRHAVVADVPVVGGCSGTDDVDYYGGHLVCETVTEANAERIIACVNACKGINPEAVPDLLEACEALPLDKFRDGEPPDAADFKDNADAFLRAMRLARVAIAKATGK